MLRVSGKNFSIGDAMRDHVIARIDTATQKYFSGSVSGHVIIDHEGSGYRSDCTLHLASGVTMHVEGRAHEPYASFDQAAERLERRLSRYKRRLKQHHTGGQAQADAGETVRAYTIEAPAHEDSEDTAFHPVVIAERTQGLKQMPVSEAVIELDFTGRSVLLFRHATSGRVNVVYRRSDGNIGWLDPAALEPQAKP
jgi:ribosomal subunit interface protein